MKPSKLYEALHALIGERVPLHIWGPCGVGNPKRWNEACDYAINPILLDAGLHLPEGVLVDDRFREMSAEQIYNQLQTEAEQEPGGPDDTKEAGGDGATSPSPTPGESGELSAPVTEGGIGQVLDAPVADEETLTAEEQAREWSIAVNHTHCFSGSRLQQAGTKEKSRGPAWPMTTGMSS
jgi:hypothetical protein